MNTHGSQWGDRAMIFATTAVAMTAGLSATPAKAQGADNPNLALHKSYACSDPNTHNFGAGGLTDGSWADTGSATFATNETATFPKTATIDLGQVSPVAAVVLGVPPFGSTKTVSVAVSADGATFKDGGSFAFDQGKEERHAYTFPSTPARYVRITYVSQYATSIIYPPTFAFTEECEVYAKDPGDAYLASLPVAAALPPPQAAPVPVAAPAAAPNPLDLAFGKPYTSSDPNAYNWGISRLTDGSWEPTANHCFASGDADSFPKTATIDLGSEQNVSAIALGVPPFGSTKTINVSLSADGTSFAQVGSHVFDQSKEERNTYTFPTTQTRYIRLTYPDHYDAMVQYSPTFVFTEECEVYAKAADASK